MKRFDWKYWPIAGMFLLSTAVAPVFRAQDAISVTRIRTDPPDALYSVDGTVYTGMSSANWPAGSKHVIYATTPQNPPGKLKTVYVWRQWEFGTNGVIKINPAPVTASTSVPEYVARFDIA